MLTSSQTTLTGPDQFDEAITEHVSMDRHIHDTAPPLLLSSLLYSSVSFSLSSVQRYTSLYRHNVCFTSAVVEIF